MKQALVRNTMRDALLFVLIATATAGLVIMLGTASENLLPALAVLAFMTPVVASAAVQLHRDVQEWPH